VSQTGKTKKGSPLTIFLKLKILNEFINSFLYFDFVEIKIYSVNLCCGIYNLHPKATNYIIFIN